MRLLSGKHTEEEATAARKEIAALTTEYEQLEARIRETSPQYAALDSTGATQTRRDSKASSRCRNAAARILARRGEEFSLGSHS